MALSVRETIQLEQALVREGLAETAAEASLMKRASAWFMGTRLSPSRPLVDSETFAVLCEALRFPAETPPRVLAAGALRIAERDADSHPHRAEFAARFAAHRLRALSGPQECGGGLPLSEKEAADAHTLYEAALGDTSYSDEELRYAADNFIERFTHEPAILGRLAADLKRLFSIVANGDAPLQHREIARAALTYFAISEDSIPDGTGLAGFFDDAWVVRRAIAEVDHQRGALASLLDEVVRAWPFVRNVAFDTGDVPQPLSEFQLISSSLLIEATRREQDATRGVALITPVDGPLPLVMGFLAALAEAARHVESERRAFIKGEFLLNPETKVGVLFDGYGRLSGKEFQSCEVSEATHIAFYESSRGKREKAERFDVRRVRAIDDVVSFRRAESKPATKRGSAVFDPGQLRLGVMERLLGSAKPVVLPIDRRRIVVVSQLNLARDILGRLTIFGTPIHEVLPTGQTLNSDTRFDYLDWGARGDGYGPLLVIVRSASEAAALVDERGNEIAAVIVPVRRDSADAASVTRISGSSIPVVAIINEQDGESVEHFRSAGYSCWTWDRNWLSALYWPQTTGESTPIAEQEKRLQRLGTGQSTLQVLNLPGLSEAHSALKELQKVAEDNELLRSLVKEGFGLLLSLCGFYSPSSEVSEASEARIAAFEATAVSGTIWWPDETQALIDDATISFRRAIGALTEHNPKAEAVRTWVTSHPNGSVVCGRQRRQTPTTIDGSTDVHFAERVDDLVPAALVPAWLGRKRMARLLFPPCATDLSLLLYEPELEWYRAAISRREQALATARTFAADRPSFERVRHDRPSSPPADSHAAPLDPDDIDIGSRRERALVYLHRASGDATRARLVHFVGGAWAAFTALHRVLIVTHLVGRMDAGDAKIRESEASEVQPGDVLLLLRGSSRDAIRAAVDEVAPKGTRARAAEWQGALRRYIDHSSIPFLAARLEAAGCFRTLGTLERWLADDLMIGPRNDGDVHAILTATQDQRLKQSIQSCVDAISTLRGLHLRAAHTLANRVVARAQEWMDVGAIPHELVELEKQLVLATVDAVDETELTVPRGATNRLQEATFED